jgi:hypothetical protein
MDLNLLNSVYKLLQNNNFILGRVTIGHEVPYKVKWVGGGASTSTPHLAPPLFSAQNTFCHFAFRFNLIRLF